MKDENVKRSKKILKNTFFGSKLFLSKCSLVARGGRKGGLGGEGGGGRQGSSG